MFASLRTCSMLIQYLAISTRPSACRSFNYGPVEMGEISRLIEHWAGPQRCKHEPIRQSSRCDALIKYYNWLNKQDLLIPDLTVRQLLIIVTFFKERCKKNTFFWEISPKCGWVGIPKQGPNPSKPPQISPKIAFFDPNFTFRSPKSHKNYLLLKN